MSAPLVRKREKLETDIGKNLSFDEKMKEDAAKMNNLMIYGSAGMVAACLVVLLPLLATQPDA